MESGSAEETVAAGAAVSANCAHVFAPASPLGRWRHVRILELVESRRAVSGPRQHTVATLGKLPGREAQVQAGWEAINDLLEGRAPAKPLELTGEILPAPPQWRQVDVRGVRVERVREFGEVYLALSLWRRLGLHKLLAELIPSGREEVPWERIACLLAIARFCAQPSELGVAERWHDRTALEDLLGSRGSRSMTTGSIAAWTRCTSTRSNSRRICSNVARAGLASVSSSCCTT